MAEKMTREGYDRLQEAGRILCKFCENDACERCQVSVLLDEAYSEMEAIEEEEETAALEAIKKESPYEVVLVVEGHMTSEHGDTGEVECNGVVEREDGDGEISYILKDGRLYFSVDAVSPQDAYDKAVLLNEAADYGDIIVDDWRLEHVLDNDGNYFYRKDLNVL